MKRLLCLMIPALVCLGAFAQPREFALRDGDTVVFLGDSITAEQTYGKIIENYTLLRYPGRRIRFINAGKGGDTAEGSLARLRRDVFDRSATVLTVAFGINDIGWGMKADADHRQKYLDAVSEIVRRCKQRHVRVFICSPAATGADPWKAESDFLEKMTDEGMQIALDAGEGAIDVLGTMRAIQKKFWKDAAETTRPEDRFTLHEKDTVHLNQYGQIAMAYAILKGLGAEADVSTASIDTKSEKSTGVECSISDLRTSGSGIAWKQTQKRLPFYAGLVGILANRYIPLAEELNRQTLIVNGLQPGRYAFTCGGRKTGVFTAVDLASGVNIGIATADAWEPGTIWAAQAMALSEVTDAKAKVEFALRTGVYYMYDAQWNADLQKRSEEISRDLEEMQRGMAAPRTYDCVLERIAD